MEPSLKSTLQPAHTGVGYAVVIPCHDEAAAIGSVVRAVRVILPAACVVVVDDGSRDRTAEEARAAGAIVEQAPANLGKGGALNLGLRRAQREGCEWAVLMDGDGQHAPEDIPVLQATARTEGADLVVGNRMGDARHMTWLRRWVNRWMSRDLSQLLGTSIPDSQCGFRLVRLAAWFRVAPDAESFLIESDTLVRFLAAGLVVRHAPVRVLGRVSGSSRIRAVRDTVRWCRWRRSLRASLRRFGSPGRPGVAPEGAGRAGAIPG